MNTRAKVTAAAAAAIVLASGGAAVATTDHAAAPAAHQVTYRLDNAACNALQEGYAAGDVETWLQRQYRQGAYAASAITVHAVDRGCGR